MTPMEQAGYIHESEPPTEVCYRCMRVQPCRAIPISGGVMLQCGVCGTNLGMEFDDEGEEISQ